MLLVLLADFENSFDQFHSAKDDIYRVVTKRERDNSVANEATVPYTLAKMLRSEIRLLPATEIYYVNEMNIKIGNGEPFNEKQVLFADSMFFKVFDFSNIHGFWVRGSLQSFLKQTQ